MEGIAGINQRMGEIHSLIASLSPSAATQASASSASLAASSTLYASGTSFADVLSSMTPGGASLAAAAAEFNSAGVPRSLAGYGNGLIPEGALAPLNGSSERMWAPAATQLNKLMADAASAGVTISVTDGYRDYDSQVRLADEKGLYSQGGLAAQPGTSEHGWGIAADLKLDATAQAWMRQHAKEYGFVENVPREPWHWEFAPAA